jgi:hypothetical protein
MSLYVCTYVRMYVYVCQEFNYVRVYTYYVIFIYLFIYDFMVHLKALTLSKIIYGRMVGW